MMRKVIVATLALSPLMLHAQANSPAQTQAANNGSVLQSSLGTSRAGALRISTGITTPKLIHSVNILTDATTTSCLRTNTCQVVVGMIVDTAGKPSNLRIIRSAGSEIDSSVLAAVSQYRFTPGMVSNQPTATPLNLEINIQSTVE